MKIQSLLLLCSTALVWGAKCPQATGKHDAQVIEHYKATGQCSDISGIPGTLEKRFLVEKKPTKPAVPPKKPQTPNTPPKNPPVSNPPPPAVPPKKPQTPNTPPKNPPVSNPPPPAKPPTNPVTAPKSQTSSAAPVGTPGAACMYCNEGKKKTPTTKPKNLALNEKYGAMFERATTPAKPGQQLPAAKQPVCIMPPAADRTGKRSISEVARSLIFPRALSEKKVSVELGRKQIGWDCYVGNYAPAGEAKDIADITKYWTFVDPATPDKCTVEVGRGTEIGTFVDDKYETDHVYEAQTLANFIKWLADETGNIGTTYTKPTADWVSKQILGEGPFRITSLGTTGVGSLNTPTAGEIPVSLMAYGFGRSDGVKSVSGGQTVERIPKARGNKNLVLLDKNINGPKGIWFRKNNLVSDWKNHVSQEKARLEVRRGVGTFKYLAAREGKLDTMWKKWARVSNWIDLVCYTFDQQYPWGTIPGEPKNLPGKTGPVSLRSMYAFFIDKEMREIEQAAANWATAAKTGFEAKWEGRGKPALTPAEAAWKREAFGAGGYATAAMMKFPRARERPAVSGEYGAYGWGDVGHDAGDKNPNIGAPTIIT